MAVSPVLDTYRRPLRNLRLSVTDRCNLRCAYCMPEQDYTWLEREHILRFEEIVALVRAFASLGVDRLRLTGGEPLLRRDLAVLVQLVREVRGIGDIALTTNGVLLGEQARPLFEAGLTRLTVSLDTLQPERFTALTRRDAHAEVLAGIRAARDAGFTGTKLDAVIMRGTNDDELFALLEYAREVGAELRYIEYMDVGGATRWSADRVVTRGEMLRSLAARYGPIEPVDETSSAPAERFRLADGTVFGIIASTTQPFCGTCDRSRLTADGVWYLCLYASSGLDLRRALRDGASETELAALIASTWTGRTDRGAEERLSSRARTSLVSIEDLRADPHLEMHTRGG